jgi:guanylate kinase
MNIDSLIITGPIGYNKSIVVNEIHKNFPKTFYHSISHTSRPIYVGEEEGIDYYFISNKEFTKMIETNQFIEFIQFNGYYYGTTKKELEKAKNNNKICLLDLNPEGTKVIQNMNNYKSISIYIVPHKLSNLERKMKYRGDSNKEIKKKINHTKDDLHNINISLYDKTISIKNINKCLSYIINYLDKKLIINQ